MNEAELEDELRGLRPASPSPSLEGRIAAALPSPAGAKSHRGHWLAERLLWASLGALGAWLLLPRSPLATPAPHAPAPASASASTSAPASVFAEEITGWSDDGVQLIDGKTPARLIRRLVVERGVRGRGLPQRVSGEAAA